MTTRGFGLAEMKQLSQLVYRVLTSPEDDGVKQKVRHEVEELSSCFPLPGVDY